jgi:predicted AAA+ superfamily ATPase
MKGASESLAGRVNFIHMGGLNCEEVGTDARNRLWLRGGFPESYLAASDEVSSRWRRSFIRTFLRQDIPSFGIDVAPERLRRFWTMAAHYHGQTWNLNWIFLSLGLDRGEKLVGNA